MKRILNLLNYWCMQHHQKFRSAACHFVLMVWLAWIFVLQCSIQNFQLQVWRNVTINVYYFLHKCYPWFPHWRTKLLSLICTILLVLLNLMLTLGFYFNLLKEENGYLLLYNILIKPLESHVDTSSFIWHIMQILWHHRISEVVASKTYLNSNHSHSISVAIAMLHCSNGNCYSPIHHFQNKR
jgi:hypothetical protein